MSAAVAVVHEMGPLESPIQPQTIAVLRMINLIILRVMFLLKFMFLVTMIVVKNWLHNR